MIAAIAVFHEYVVGDRHRDVLTGRRIDRVAPVNTRLRPIVGLPPLDQVDRGHRYASTSER